MAFPICVDCKVMQERIAGTGANSIGLDGPDGSLSAPWPAACLRGQRTPGGRPALNLGGWVDEIHTRFYFHGNLGLPMLFHSGSGVSHPPPKLRADLPGDVFDVLGDAHCILAFASTPISSRAQRAGET